MLATDELTWVQGWVPVAKGEQRRRFAAVVAQDRWVLDTVRRVAQRSGRRCGSRAEGVNAGQGTRMSPMTLPSSSATDAMSLPAPRSLTACSSVAPAANRCATLPWMSSTCQ